MSATPTAMLGLEAARKGWTHHAVDPERIKASGSAAAWCGVTLSVRPRVWVISTRDLTCEACLAEWVRRSRPSTPGILG